MTFRVINKDKAKNYFIAIVKSFEILRDIAKKEGIELNLNKNRLLSVVKKYDFMLFCLKKTIMSMGDAQFVDSHKISALFLVSLLHQKDIVTARCTKTTAMSVYPYIYLAFVLGNVIMENMFNEANKTESRIVYNINMNYAKEFVKLIHSNENALLLPAIAVECNSTYKGMFFLSHLFYFIEQVADKQADS